MTAWKMPSVEGSVTSGFVPVRDAFVENFTWRGERDVALCTAMRACYA